MTDHRDHTQNLPDDLASIDAALAELGREELASAPDTLASRTLVRTNAIIAQSASAAPVAPSVEHKPSAFMRIAAPFAVAATLALAAAISFQGATTTNPGANEAAVATIAVAFDEWLDSEDSLAFDDALDDDLRELRQELDELESTDTLTLNLSDAEYAL